MKADDMRTVLLYHEDFVTEDTIVESYLKGWGHKAYFLPKFHCELNPIERVWAQAKVYCRAYTNFTAYREGHKAGKAVEYAVKVYICTKKPAHFTARAHSRTRSTPEESLALPTMLLAFCAEV